MRFAALLLLASSAVLMLQDALFAQASGEMDREAPCEMYQKRAEELEQTIAERRRRLGGANINVVPQRFDAEPRDVNSLSEEMESDVVLARAYVNVALAKLEFVLIHLTGPCGNSGKEPAGLLEKLYDDANNIATAVPDERLEPADRKVLRSLEALLRKVLQQQITNIGRNSGPAGKPGSILGCPGGGNCPPCSTQPVPTPPIATPRPVGNNVGGVGGRGGVRGFCIFRRAFR